MLAKIAGWKHGVAKRSKPVIVRVSNPKDPGAWLDGLRQVYNDWEPTYNVNVCDQLLIFMLNFQLTSVKTAEDCNCNCESILGLE